MVQMMKHYDYSEYLKCLLDDGYLVLENYVSSNDLASLKSEFEIIIKTKQVSEKSVNSIQHSIRSKELQKNIFPSLYNITRNNVLISISNEFFAYWYSDNYNKVKEFEKIDFEKNFILGQSNNSKYHFDRIPGLKVQIYLNDVSKNNGAMGIIKNSQNNSRYIAKQMLNKNNNPLYLKNYINLDYEIFEENIIEAKAGSAIIFDTMTLHKGGEILNGSRDTIRLVNYIPFFNEKYLDFKSTNIDPSIRVNDFYHPFNHEDKTKINPRFIYNNY